MIKPFRKSNLLILIIAIKGSLYTSSVTFATCPLKSHATKTKKRSAKKNKKNIKIKILTIGVGVLVVAGGYQYTHPREKSALEEHVDTCKKCSHTIEFDKKDMRKYDHNPFVIYLEEIEPTLPNKETPCPCMKAFVKVLESIEKYAEKTENEKKNILFSIMKPNIRMHPEKNGFEKDFSYLYNDSKLVWGASVLKNIQKNKLPSKQFFTSILDLAERHKSVFAPFCDL